MGQLWVAAERVVAQRRGGDTGGAGRCLPLVGAARKIIACEARQLALPSLRTWRNSACDPCWSPCRTWNCLTISPRRKANAYRGFQLWSPRGREFGRCELLLNGRKLIDLDFHADSEQPSQAVFRLDDAGDGYHAVILRSTDGRLVVDSLDVLN